MKERGIIFSGEMVLAILEGWKTQTRRVVLPQPHNPETFGISPVWGYGVHKDGASLPGAKPGRFCLHAAFNEGGRRVDRFLPCPYGKPGERLWVRETFASLEYIRDWESNHIEDWHPAADARAGHLVYDADPHGFNDCGNTAKDRGFPWTPPIFMPRWASRIDLEITGIRVERLCTISSADAWQEGIRPDNVPWQAGDGTLDKVDPEAETIKGFADRWNDIHWKSGYSWGTNPWVWVIEFKNVTEPARDIHASLNDALRVSA